MVRKEANEKRKVWKVTEDGTRARLEGRVEEMVSADAKALWSDEVCGKKNGRRDQGDTWWWNENVKEAIARNKDAQKEMCKMGRRRTSQDRRT